MQVMELGGVKIIFAILSDGFAGFWHVFGDEHELKMIHRLKIDTAVVQDTRK